MTRKHTFKKEERLKSAQRINEVYTTGTQFFAHPFKCFVLPGTADVSKICVSAPKRLFKSAVDRNTIKRRSKEAYRLNKEQLQGVNADIYLIYISKKVEDYATIEKGIVKLLGQITSN